MILRYEAAGQAVRVGWRMARLGTFRAQAPWPDLIRVAAVYRADGHLPGGRIVFLLDEIARLGFMAARARDAGRKYGITLVLLYQSEGQMTGQWGEGGRAAWFESASWRAYAAVGPPKQAKVFSEACGEHGIVTASESASASRGTRMLSPASRSTETHTSDPR